MPDKDSTIRLVPLTQGKFAIVDVADFERVNQWKWCASHSKKHDIWYAQRELSRAESPTKRRSISMHRFLMDAPAGMYVDHKDGNGLNNSRSTNLRLATNSQNRFNRGAQKNNSSGVKGVSLHKVSGKWQAVICVNGQQKHLGLFTTRDAAAEAYANAAREFHGEFAKFEV